MTEDFKFRTTQLKFPENFEQDSFKSSTKECLGVVCFAGGIGPIILSIFFRPSFVRFRALWLAKEGQKS